MEKLLTPSIWKEICAQTTPNRINEIRIRLYKPIYVKTTDKDFFVQTVVDRSYMENFIGVATNHSRYAHENELSDGYLVYGNGVRIGIGGRGQIKDHREIIYSLITSACIRVPHVITVDPILSLTENFKNTLIIGPPYSGKTTFIRAMANKLAAKTDLTVIDERMEIAGSDFSLLTSARADIVQGIKKEYVYEKIIRSLSPQIIVCDELMEEQDYYSVQRIVRSGIKCLASVHGETKNAVPEILQSVFETFVFLSSKPRPGSILSIERKND